MILLYLESLSKTPLMVCHVFMYTTGKLRERRCGHPRHISKRWVFDLILLSCVTPNQFKFWNILPILTKFVTNVDSGGRQEPFSFCIPTFSASLTNHITKYRTRHKTSNCSSHCSGSTSGNRETYLVTLAQLLRIMGSNLRFFFLSDCRALELQAPGFAALATSVEARRQNTRDFMKITVLPIRQI
jgi:hypothetical protein